MSETKNIVSALSKLSAHARNIFGTRTGDKKNKYSQLQEFIGDINELMEKLELSIHIVPGVISTEVLNYEKKWTDNKTNQQMSKSVTEVVGKISCRTFVTHSSGEMMDFGVSEFPLDINGGMASAKANAAFTYARKQITLGLCNIHFTDDEVVFVSQVDEFIESIGIYLLDEASIFMAFGDLKLKFEMAKNQKALDYLNSRKHEMTRRKNDLLSRIVPTSVIISSNEYKQLLDTIKSELKKQGKEELVDAFMEGFKAWYAGLSSDKGQRIDDPRKMLREHLDGVLKELPEVIANYRKF